MSRLNLDFLWFAVGLAFLIANVVLLMAGLATPITYIAIVTLAFATPMAFFTWRDGIKR